VRGRTAGLPSFLDGAGPNARGAQNEDGTGIHRAGPSVSGVGARLAAVERIVDGHAGRVTRDAQLERRIVETAFVAEPQVVHGPRVHRDVCRSRSGEPEELPGTDTVGNTTVGDIRRLLAVFDVVDQGLPVGGIQIQPISCGAQSEPRVQACIANIVVGPYHQEAPRRDPRQRRLAGRDLPASRIIGVVRQIHPADVNGHIRRIVQLDPIVILALGVFHTLMVRGQQFVDHHRSAILGKAIGVSAGSHAENQRDDTEDSDRCDHLDPPFRIDTTSLLFPSEEAFPDDAGRLTVGLYHKSGPEVNCTSGLEETLAEEEIWRKTRERGHGRGCSPTGGAESSKADELNSSQSAMS